MKRNYSLSHKLVAAVLLLSLFLQSCENSSNQLVPQEKESPDEISGSSKDIQIDVKPLVDKELTEEGGNLVTFHKQGDSLKADVITHETADSFKPTICKNFPVKIVPDVKIEQLPHLSKIEQKKFIHVNLPKNDQPGSVEVKNMRLLGGVKRSIINKGDEDQEGEKEQEKEKEKVEDKEAELEEKRGYMSARYQELLRLADVEKSVKAQFLLGHRAYAQWKKEGQKEQDYQEATYWLKEAEGQGYQAAIILLKELQLLKDQASDGNTSLHLAIKQVDATLENQFKEVSMNLNDFRNRDSTTLKHLCFMVLKDIFIKEVKEAIILLLQLGADIHAKNKDGDTPLHLAAQKGYLGIVKLILKLTADTHTKNNKGQAPLHMAAVKGHLQVVKLLLDKKAKDIYNKDKEGHTALHCAVQGGTTELVKLLIEKGANINTKDKEGCTPLYLAAQGGHIGIVKLLLEKGANINAKDDDDCTPLIIAAQEGHTAIVKLLLEHGVDVNAKDNDGYTPLSIAAREGHTAIVKLLLEHGADVNAKNKYGCAHYI